MAILGETERISLPLPDGPALVYVHTDDDTITQPDHGAGFAHMSPRERALMRALLQLALANLDEAAQIGPDAESSHP